MISVLVFSHSASFLINVSSNVVTSICGIIFSGSCEYKVLRRAAILMSRCSSGSSSIMNSTLGTYSLLRRRKHRPKIENGKSVIPCCVDLIVNLLFCFHYIHCAGSTARSHDARPKPIVVSAFRAKQYSPMLLNICHVSQPRKLTSRIDISKNRRTFCFILPSTILIPALR